ncbi:MAG: PmoA family protein [Pirellulales bacterium]|nr:PmoA family protein [Pirellulales bacterium]
MQCNKVLVLLGEVAAALFVAAAVPAVEMPLPNAKSVPDMQVLPLPYDQATFEYLGRELTPYHFGDQLRRPFWYPIVGPAGRSLTRMNMPGDPGRSLTQDVQPQDPDAPEDPLGHSHQTSVWISHKDVNGIDFWRDGGPIAGQIVHQTSREGLRYEDGPGAASLLTLNHWNDPQGRILMIERRRATVAPGEGGSWWMTIDLEFQAPPDGRVTLGQTPFGPIGVRMAKTIGVTDGGSRILNSAGQRNEAEAFRKPARWVDYSGPITNEHTAGITLMDHPANPNHPAPFHVRDNGWMGISLTLEGPVVITAEKPLRLRYGLWIHPQIPDARKLGQQWQAFARSKLASMGMKSGNE